METERLLLRDPRVVCVDGRGIDTAFTCWAAEQERKKHLWADVASLEFSWLLAGKLRVQLQGRDCDCAFLLIAKLHVFFFF